MCVVLEPRAHSQSTLVMPCPAITAEMRAAAQGSGWRHHRAAELRNTDLKMWSPVRVQWTTPWGRATVCCRQEVAVPRRGRQVQEAPSASGESRALAWVSSESRWHTARRAAAGTPATASSRTTSTTSWKDQELGLSSTMLLCKCFSVQIISLRGGLQPLVGQCTCCFNIEQSTRFMCFPWCIPLAFPKS